MIKCTECDEPVHDKETGLCDKHYKRYKRHGNPFAVYGVDESMQSDSCHECGQPAKVKSKGLCWKCYKRWQRKNKSIQIKQPKEFSIKPLCAGIGCEKEAVSLGYCQTHYMRLRKHGNPETVLPSVKPRQHWICTIFVLLRGAAENTKLEDYVLDICI